MEATAYKTTRYQNSEDHTAQLCGQIFSSDHHVDLESCPICHENYDVSSVSDVEYYVIRFNNFQYSYAGATF